MQRIAYKDGFVRPYRVSTMRKITKLEGVDRGLVIVADCWINKDGVPFYGSPEEVEAAVDNEQLSWGDLRTIAEIAGEMVTGSEKKD